MNSDSRGSRPELRILHQMARSGGTVICRCLASMDNVVLLSEIHPQGTKMFNPLQQADQWHGLLTAQDAEEFRSSPPDFAAAIVRIERRCREQGKILLIRDWSHLDYTGVPFVKPAYRSLLAESLEPHFSLLRFSTVRNPVDQWLSITRNPQFRSRLSVDAWLDGCLRFAQQANSTGFARYEDFTANPDRVLEEICRALELPFDAGYADRWSQWDRITGDVLPGRAGDEIRHLPRQPGEKGMLEAILGQDSLNPIQQLLGYESASDSRPPGDSGL